MADLTLSLMTEDGDQMLLEMVMKGPDEDVDLFRAQLEDYFVGMAVTKSKPNLFPTDVEVL